MGSKSDLPVMKEAALILEELQVPIRQEGRAEQGEDSLGAGELVL